MNAWEILIAIIGASALWKFIEFLINRKDNKKEAEDKMAEALTELQDAIAQLQTSVNENNVNMALQSEALMAIAQDRILWLGRQYIKQGWIYEDELKNIRRMADAYKAMNGNGDVKIIMGEVDKLPVHIRETI